MRLLVTCVDFGNIARAKLVTVITAVSDEDQDKPTNPPFLELSISSIGELSYYIPVAESFEIEVDPYGASTIAHIRH
ncbi:hypothetical protein CHS0354_042751 [Potamilus streckersoni]|uniref:Uncharacterized protein n=1 Tax=Potamilus streckersoni TaxID=2493646 RepID=A0AAE0S9K5_9BIVA|nr:hypothetical protein CHS0354_042751 [Potamilus streckersoni]